MSIQEKEIAEAIVHYELKQADGETTVPIQLYLGALHMWLEREQVVRLAEHDTALAESYYRQPDVLEGTDEYNRGHEAAIGAK